MELPNGDGKAERDRRLQILKTVSDLLEQAGDLPGVINCVQQEFPRLLDVDRASVLIYDASRGVLVDGQFKGATGWTGGGCGFQPPGLSISGLCFTQAKPIIVNDCPNTDIIPAPFVNALGLKSCASVPIILEGLPMGVMRLDDTRRTGRFSENDLEFYLLVAERISFAIRHCQLSADRTLAEEALRLVCEELEHRVDARAAELASANAALSRELAERRRAELVAETFARLGHKLSLADTPGAAAEATLLAADELFGWDACYANLLTATGGNDAIFMVDVIDGERRLLEAEYGSKELGPFTRTTLDQGPQLILRYEADRVPVKGMLPFGSTDRRSASMMFAPVQRQGQNIGVLSIQSYRANAYGPKELEFFTALAAFCGGALERTTARENLVRSQAALRQESALVKLLGDICAASNGAESVNEALQSAVDRICSVTGWPVGHALLPVEGRGGEELLSAGIWHLDDPALYARFRAGSEALKYGPGLSLPGVVASSMAPAFALISDPQPWMRRTEMLEEAGLRAGFAFPVLVGEEVGAVLEFFTREPEPPSEHLQEVLGHVGVQLGRVVERKRAEERLSHGSLHDALTGLPNRVFLMDYVERAVARAHRTADYSFALLYLDLDRFKMVNDSLGHAAGDRLLVATARRLEDCLRAGDIVSRLGGDEFAILLDSIEGPNDAVTAADRIQEALSAPFILDSCESRSGASIGIVLSRFGGADDATSLLRDADVAMYRAKLGGRGRYAVFDEQMHAEVLSRLRMEMELRHALEADELVVHYQPIVSMATGRIAGFEALVRWNHPSQGLLLPADFLPLAEESGLIIPLGWEVLRQACAWLRRRMDIIPGGEHLTISVNITASQLREPDLLLRIEEALASAGLPAENLHLEVTEGTVMENVEATVEILTQLHDLGIQVLVDDFGTGYSSLSYLARFPIDALKIDQSFIQGLSSNQGHAEVVQAILALACGLRLGVVAEGVETKAQLAALQGLGCELTQGFLFSRPMDPEAALEMGLEFPELALN